MNETEYSEKDYQTFKQIAILLKKKGLSKSEARVICCALIGKPNLGAEFLKILTDYPTAKSEDIGALLRDLLIRGYSEA